ncbi:MAG: hypothetical protein AB7V46_07280 [Thermomicrobiales bacterium]
MTDHFRNAESRITEATAQAVAAIASLPLDQRKVLTVAIASDLTYTDIASQGGFSADQVLAWMRDGLHTISDALDAADSEDLDSR